MTFPLSPSVKIPQIGLGTWELRGALCVETVQLAIELGYRHIDTAESYHNHAEIGEAIRGFERTLLFLTSKFTLPQTTSASVEAICDQALKELRTEYLDLYLLHYPDRSFDISAILKEAEQLIEKRKIRALGVSNFTQRHLQDAIDQGIKITVNQVEYHPYLNQQALLTFCQKNQIHLTSYRSLGKGALTQNPVIQAIALKHQKAAAQICLRWLLDKGISVIPKAKSKEHLKQNLDALNFTLDKEDHQILDHIQEQRRFCNQPWFDFHYL